MIPKAFIEELTQITDIESVVGDYVDLDQVGANLKGVCPFCHVSTFTVSNDKQIYKCFKCLKGGGVVGFVQEIEKKTFPAAIHFLADRLKLQISEVEG